MPTNKEIAGWLREEKDMYVRLSEITEGAVKDLLLAKVQLIEDRAAQVEQSTTGRCESFRWWENKNQTCRRRNEYELHPVGLLAICAHNFGCIHWEQKP